jgi:antitoxin CptB
MPLTDCAADTGSDPGLRHQDDAARRRRLRWRARRGLLENDLVLGRFFERYEHELDDDDVAGLDQLLDVTDNELLDLILARTELDGDAATPGALRVLDRLRRV